MEQVLNAISVLSAFFFGVGAIYWVFDITIGKISLLKSKYSWNGLEVKDFVFLFIAAVILLKSTHFYQPY